MKESGKYRVTHHLGRGPNKEDAKVIFSHLDEEPAGGSISSIFRRGSDTSSPCGDRTAR